MSDAETDETDPPLLLCILSTARRFDCMKN